MKLIPTNNSKKNGNASKRKKWMLLVAVYILKSHINNYTTIKSTAVVPAAIIGIAIIFQESKEPLINNFIYQSFDSCWNFYVKRNRQSE